MNLKELRSEYRKQLHTKFGFKEMDVETTREYCQLYGYEFPEGLNFKWAKNYDWGNDYYTDAYLTFFTDEKPDYYECCVGNIDRTHYGLLRIPINYDIDPAVIKYPYTEEELIEIQIEKLKKQKRQLNKKNKKNKPKAEPTKLKTNVKPETTKMKFGKYKGQLVTEIINTDKNYIEWCINNINGFADYINKIIENDKTENKTISTN